MMGFSHVKGIYTTTIGFIFLILATGLTSVFGLVVKSADHTGRNPVSVGSINYMFAAIASGLILLADQAWQPDAATVLIGAATGVFYVVAFWYLVIAVRQGGVAITMAIVRLGVLIPILCSIFIWYETPSVAQTVGILFVCISLPLLSIGVAENKMSLGSTIWLIGMLFVTTGFCHLSPKIFRELAPQGDETVYLFSLFSVAGVLSLIFIKKQGIPLQRRDYGHGILQGICNLLGTYSIAMALKYLPGTFVFPFTSAAGVALTTAAATIIWKEKLGLYAYVGIALSIIALVLIN